MTAIYEKIIKYIDEHISDEITIDDLSKFAGYSKWNIYKLFSAYNDLPVMEYIRRKKLSAAANELRSNKKLYDIALDFGYETPAGFYKAFQSIFGCSPSNYKNNLLRSTNMDNIKIRTIEELNDLIELEPNNAEFYIERGLSRWNSSQLDKALENYNKAIELDPLKGFLYTNRAGLYLQMKQYDKALENYTWAIQLDPGQAFYHGQGGHIYSYFYSQQFEKIDKILDDLNNTIKINPDESWIYYLCAIIYSQHNQLEKSIENYTKAIELEPDKYLYRNRAKIYMQLNKIDKAEEDLTKTLEFFSNPNSVQEYLERGRIYQYLKQYDKTLEEFNKAIELYPDNMWVWLNRGLLYHNALNEYEKALEDYNKTLEINPNYVWGYSRCGDCYVILEQYDKAIDNYSKAIELEPNCIGLYFNRANCYENLKQYNKAEEDYNKTIELDPNQLPMYLHRGWNYEELGEYGKAIEYFSKAMELEPDAEWVYKIYEGRTRCYAALNQFDKVDEDCAKMIEFNPEYEIVWVYRACAWRCTILKQYDKAAEMLEKAIECNPNLLSSLEARVYNCFLAGQYDKAIEYATEALKIIPGEEDPEKQAHMALYRSRGRAYGQIGEYGKAEEDLNRALELDPECEETRECLDEILKK